MSPIKKIIFLITGFISASILGIIILELFFGSWLNEDKWKEANSINIIRNRQLTFSVKHIYGEKMNTVSYSRDEFGLRGTCKEPKDITILTLGGSTTDQRLISDGKTYQDVLQALLREKMGFDICISNAGVDGHSTFGHLASFEKWFPLIPSLKPKYFLLYIGINDAGFISKPISIFDTHKRLSESSLLITLRENSALFQLFKKSRDIFLSLNSHNAYAEHSSRPPLPSEYTSQGLSADSISLVQDNLAFPQFSRQILLSKSEWEKCKCKEPNTQLNSKKRQFAKLSTGATLLLM